MNQHQLFHVVTPPDDDLRQVRSSSSVGTCTTDTEDSTSIASTSDTDLCCISTPSKHSIHRSMALFQNQLKVMNDKIDLLGERIMATRNSTRMRYQENIKQQQDLLLPRRLYLNQEVAVPALTSANLVFQQLPRKKVSIGIQVDLTQFEYNHESSCCEDSESIISSEDSDDSS